MALSCKLRYLRYLLASVLGSVFTVVVMSMRETALYGHFSAQAQAEMRSRGLDTSGSGGWEASVSAECRVVAPVVVRSRGRGAWQVFGGGRTELMVYGAYYDDRQVASQNHAVIRVFGVASTPKTTPVFCQLWYDDTPSRKSTRSEPPPNRHSQTNTDSSRQSAAKTERQNIRETNNGTRRVHSLKPVITMATLSTPGRGYTTSKHIHYQEYLFSCAVSGKDSLPISVSLVFHPCQNSTILTPVIYTDKHPNRTLQFGVCVAAAYGDVAPRRLTEWTELLHILGVGEISVYVTNVTRRTEKVLRYYEHKGLVTIRHAPSPLDHTSYWAGKLAVISGFNDCLYRNMYRYKYTIIIDFDEVIVPHMHSNYSAMMADLRTFHSRLKVTPGLLLFRNAYFFLDMDATRNTSDLTVMSHTRRVDISPRSYSAKSLFDPRVCIIAWNHFCLLRVPRTAVLNVDPLYALSHHYKKCHFRRDECQHMMSRNVTDTAILKFRLPLRRRLKKLHIT